MTYRQFVYMYDQSAEIRSRVSHWLKSNPPPDNIQPLKWALHKFIEGMVAKPVTGNRFGPKVRPAIVSNTPYDPDRFTVPKSAILEEARGRAAHGEDAGAAVNKEAEKNYPKDMRNDS